MKLVAIKRYGDFDMPYVQLYIGKEDSTDLSTVLVLLSDMNAPVYTFEDKEKLYKKMVSFLQRNGYVEFEPHTITISD